MSKALEWRIVRTFCELSRVRLCRTSKSVSKRRVRAKGTPVVVEKWRAASRPQRPPARGWRAARERERERERDSIRDFSVSKKKKRATYAPHA